MQGDLNTFRIMAKARANRALMAVAFTKYSPDQPRDERGRWTDAGGRGGGGVPRLRTRLGVNITQAGIDQAKQTRLRMLAELAEIRQRRTDAELDISMGDEERRLGLDAPETAAYREASRLYGELDNAFKNKQREISNLETNIERGEQQLRREREGKAEPPKSEKPENLRDLLGEAQNRAVNQEALSADERFRRAADALASGQRTTEGLKTEREIMQERVGLLQNVPRSLKEITSDIINVAGTGAEFAHQTERREQSERAFLRESTQPLPSHEYRQQLGNTINSAAAVALRVARAANDAILIGRNVADIAQAPDWITVGVRLNDIVRETARLRQELKALPPTAKVAVAQADHQLALTQRAIARAQQAASDNSAEGRIRFQVATMQLGAAARRLATLPKRLAVSTYEGVTNIPTRVRSYWERRRDYSVLRGAAREARRRAEREEAIRRFQQGQAPMPPSPPAVIT